MATRETSVELDVELLAAAQAALKTTTIKDTIEEAFLEVLRARARKEEVEAPSTLEGMDLADAEVMSKARRR